MTIRKEVLDELLSQCKKPEDLTGPEGLLSQLTGALVGRMLDAELTEHLGYQKHDPAGRGTGNSRNGHSKKTLKTEQGPIEIQVPRDREGSFEPKLVGKRQTHFEGFDDAILSLYGRGMTVREIQGHLKSLYKVDVSPDLISRVTDAVLEDVRAWRNRPLEPVWPILILDALVLKVRDKGTVHNKSAYLALGIGLDGRKQVLGLWIEQAEGAKLWLSILTELKNRGVEDVLLACCDGLKGFPDAIEACFPKAVVQTCIVHMIRNSLRYVSWKDRRKLSQDLRPVYTADTREAAEAAMDSFEAVWGASYPQVARSWRANWERVVPFLEFPAPIRRVIYTTNAIESLNASLRQVLSPRRHFPTDEAALKVLYLAIVQREERWTRQPKGWNEALQHLSVHFQGRLPI